MVRGLIIVICLFISVSANICFADTLSDLTLGIESYKSGNYNDCISKLNTVIKSDPTSVLGYYYLGLAYSKTGKKDLAQINYTKVINLGSDKTLTSLAKKAKSAVKDYSEPETAQKQDETTEEYNPILNDSVVTTQEQTPNPKEKITDNNSKEPNHEPKSEPKTQTSNLKPAKFEFDPNREPTNDEIVNAIRILQKAGLLQNGAAAIVGGTQAQTQQNQQTQYQQSAIQDTRNRQMNSMLMMMNGGNNNMMQMMPYMQNDGKIDPQLMQMMLMQQMMPNFSGGNNDRY